MYIRDNMYFVICFGPNVANAADAQNAADFGVSNSIEER